MGPVYRYMLKLLDGQRLYAAGHNPEEAARAAGVSLSQVRRHMPIEYLDKPPMPEETKEKLRQLAKEKRELKRAIGANKRRKKA